VCARVRSGKRILSLKNGPCGLFLDRKVKNMSKSATESSDPRTDTSKSFNDYLKRAEAEFLGEVGRIVNAKQKYCTCRVRDGISMSFLIVEGTDISDFDLSGSVSLTLASANFEATVHLDFDSMYKRKVQRSHAAKIGLITVDMVAEMVLEIIGARR